ncbi:MAG: hypothetical protein HUU18_11720 [Phycisphaerales bacterium]|jgi:hypothetical protein|nr:hypothetical protein [Phycisphaerales bacterium]
MRKHKPSLLKTILTRTVNPVNAISPSCAWAVSTTPWLFDPMDRQAFSRTLPRKLDPAEHAAPLS